MLTTISQRAYYSSPGIDCRISCERLLLSKTCVKPGLHIVVRVAERACDDASKRILKTSTYRLQIFLVRDQYLRSLLQHRDQTIAGLLEKHVLKLMLAILTIYLETRLRPQLQGAIYRSDSFVLMLSYCVNLKAIRYDSMSLN